jgi:hypothetical protein
MAEIPYFIRYKEVTTLDNTDSLFLDDASSDVPKKISFSDFVTEVGGVIPAPTSNAYAEKTANYTLTSTDFTINCTANTFTITLPTAVGITGRCFEITNTGSGQITLAPDGVETIQGDATQTIYQDECFVIRSTGANWIVI